MPGGQGDERRQPGALVSERVLHDLDHDLVALAHEITDVWHVVAVLGHPALGNIGCVQEGRAAEADIDESSLHARQYPQRATFVYIADQTSTRCAFDIDLLQHAVLEQRRANLARGHVDQDLFF